MAIKELITLEGVEQVEAQLARINVAGEKSLKQFSDLGQAGSSGGGFDKLVQGAKSAGLEMDKTSESTLKLSTVFKALKPVIHEAGLEIGNFGALGRLASTSIVGFGAALTGAVIVGLAGLEEKTARARGQLADLFRSNEKGDQAFAALTTGAKEFGSTVAGLTPGLVAFQTALSNVDKTAQGFVALRAEDLPGGGPRNVRDITEAYTNFIKILRAGRLDQDEAQKSAKAFFDTLKDGGPITKAALQALPVGTVELLKQAMGAAGLSTKAFFQEVEAGNVTVEKLKAGLAGFGPEAERAFQLKAIKTFSDEIGKLLATLSDGFGKLTGKPFSDFVIGELARIRKGLQDTIQEGQDFIELLRRIEKATEIPGIGKLASDLTGRAFVGPTLEQAGLAGAAFLPTPEQAGKIGADAADAFREGFLKKGFVFPPKPVQDAGADIAANLGKGFIDNKFFQEEAPAAIVEPIQNIIKTGLVIPDEAQAALAEQFKATGANAGKGFNEGVTSQQLDVSTWLGDVASQISSLAQSWFASVQAAFSQPIKVNFDTGGFGGQLGGAPFAAGGHVRGPGSTTSDSIMAWLSDFEYVINARAVRHYGADLFGALNAMALPRDFMNRFAMGGLARVSGGNHLAAGGQVRGTPVTINIDRHTFNMTAGDDTVAAIKRFAVAAQISSTGRKPRFVR
jgi:hypothetical protein